MSIAAGLTLRSTRHISVNGGSGWKGRDARQVGLSLSAPRPLCALAACPLHAQLLQSVPSLPPLQAAAEKARAKAQAQQAKKLAAAAAAAEAAAAAAAAAAEAAAAEAAPDAGAGAGAGGPGEGEAAAASHLGEVTEWLPPSGAGADPGEPSEGVTPRGEGEEQSQPGSPPDSSGWQQAPTRPQSGAAAQRAANAAAAASPAKPRPNKSRVVWCVMGGKDVHLLSVCAHVGMCVG